MIDAMTESDDASGEQDWRNEARDLYERYIDAFNARDEATFFGFFHLPVSIMRLPAGGADGPGSSPHLVTDRAQLWPVLPATWTRSTIDDLRVLAGADAFTPRSGFTDRSARRVALQVTVTRWAGDEPYEQVHVLYLLTREGGRLGIKAMVPLAVAGPPTG
jgi:hypothetical protein